MKHKFSISGLSRAEADGFQVSDEGTTEGSRTFRDGVLTITSGGPDLTEWIEETRATIFAVFDRWPDVDEGE